MNLESAKGQARLPAGRASGRTDLAPDLDGQNRSHGWLAQTTSTYWVRSYPGGPFVLTRNLSQNTYSYNAGGIRTANAVSLYNQPTRVEQYAYDALNRLTAVDYADGVTQGYTFDNMGNRLTKTEGGTTETYGYNAANMLVSRKG